MISTVKWGGEELLSKTFVHVTKNSLILLRNFTLCNF